MGLRRVVVGLAAVLMAGTALAQTIIPQNIERATNTNVQPYAPVDGRQAPAQAFSPQQFAQPRGQVPVDPRNTGWSEHRAGIEQAPPREEYRQPGYRPEYRPGAPTQPVVDYRQPQRQPQATPPLYAPAPDMRTQDVRVQDVRMQDMRMQDRAADPRPVNPPPAYAQPGYEPRPQLQQPRPDMRPAAIEARQPERPAVQDFRNPAGALKPAQQIQPEQPRFPVYEARPGVVDPRVVMPRKEEYIDYKMPEGRAYDFRPLDYKPVDARTLEYRSQDNKTPDQKVLDPRLKEKGPEIQAALECRAIMYRAVECNFLDYREIDPKLQELFAKYPEVAFGIVPKEYSKELIDRWQPLLTHLSAQVGLKISLKVANDYQALMESQRAGLVHVAIYSPLAYARARASGVKVDAFAVETNPDGGKGGFAMVYGLARGAAGAPKGDDARGKSIGLVDPNSVSGYFVPRMMAAAQKADPDQYWSRQVFTGSHENALVALSQGLVDLAVGHWNSDEDSSLTRALSRGLLRHPDGAPMRREDFRVLMKSEMIANAPIAYLSEMPEDLKGILRRALLEAPMRDRTAFDRIYDGKAGWEATEPKVYDGAVELVKFMDAARQRQQQAAVTRQQVSR